MSTESWCSMANDAVDTRTSETRAHDWTGPRPPIRHVHCRICGIIKNVGKPNGPCKGPVKVGPR